MPLQRPEDPSSTSSATGAPPPPELPPFADCPHSSYVQDPSLQWYAIVSPRACSNFDVCPTCFETSIKPTNYAQFFSPAPPKPPNTPVRCDFSQAWVRIAWAWLFSLRYPDASLLASLSYVRVPEGPCPNATLEDPKPGQRVTVTRVWYSLRNPQNGAVLDDFTVCSDCIARIDTVFAQLRGSFVPAANGQPVPATCDVFTPGSQRGLKIIDKYSEVAAQAAQTGQFDLIPVADYIQKFALVPECPKLEVVKGRKCYSLPAIVPEFTACEECYLEAVEPGLRKATLPSNSFLKQISQITPAAGFTCQLNSPRTKQTLQDAVNTNDAGYLRQKVIERSNKLVELKTKIEALEATYHQQKMQAKYHQEMALLETRSALNNTLCWQMSTGFLPVTDFTQSNSMMHQGANMNIAAAKTLDEISMLNREWLTYWD